MKNDTYLYYFLYLNIFSTFLLIFIYYINCFRETNHVIVRKIREANREEIESLLCNLFEFSLNARDTTDRTAPKLELTRSFFEMT